MNTTEYQAKLFSETGNLTFLVERSLQAVSENSSIKEYLLKELAAKNEEIKELRAGYLESLTKKSEQ